MPGANRSDLERSARRMRVATWFSGPLAILALAATFSSLGADLSSASDSEDFAGDWAVYWILLLLTTLVFVQGSRVVLNHEVARVLRQRAEGEADRVAAASRVVRRARVSLWIGVAAAIVAAAGVFISIGVITSETHGDAAFPVLLVLAVVFLFGARLAMHARRSLRSAQTAPSGPQTPGSDRGS